MSTNIVVTTTTFAQYDRSPLDLLRKKGFNVVVNPHKRKLSPGEVIGLCGNAVGIIAGTESLDASILERLPFLKVISRCGTGLENVDCKMAHKLGIGVYNTPDGPTLAVSELTVGLILNLLRHVHEMDSSTKRGEWDKKTGNLLYGKKVGIIGFGRIGKALASLLKAFGCAINYCDPFVAGEFSRTKKMALAQILRNSDIISIHASSGKTLLGRAEIGMMKKGAWLVNTSRGEVVDERALYSALKNGHLSGAALDVFTKEPYEGPIAGLKNVILTPHIGSYAVESRIKMEMEAVNNLFKGLSFHKIKGALL